MRVHFRLSERRTKKRHDELHISRLPFIRGTVVCVVGFERCIMTGKMEKFPFSPRPWARYYDTHYRLPTRQMGWSTLGCNQQDLWGTSERFVNCKPARMVPKVAGGRAANTAHQNQTF